MIKIKVNNEQNIFLAQVKDDIFVTKMNSLGDVIKSNVMNEGDMVMLLNYYNYVKENDIQCDFINPQGRKMR